MVSYRIRWLTMQLPYLWKYTAVGRPGKYVADDVYDPAAADAEGGYAAILRVLVEQGAVSS